MPSVLTSFQQKSCSELRSCITAELDLDLHEDSLDDSHFLHAFTSVDLTMTEL